MLGFTALLTASNDLGVTVNTNTGSIHLIDPITHAISEPFFKSELGTQGSALLDVAITSDGTKAIVSNFSDSRIFIIDISKGFNSTPTLLGSIFTTMRAEDIAITPDDKYAMVTAGPSSRRIGVFDIANQELVNMKNIFPLQAQAIAVTPDGQLVIVAEYLDEAIHSFWLDSDGNLTHKETQRITPFNPVNIAISPDGKTLIAPAGFHSVLPVFSIDSQHNLCFKEYIPLPSRGSQSCVFSKDGTKAFLLINGNQSIGTIVSVLNITGPGQVSASGTTFLVEPTRGTGKYYGVDTIALDPSENYLYVTNPTSAGAVAGVSLLDLTTYTQVDFLKTKGSPTGIAFTTIQ